MGRLHYTWWRTTWHFVADMIPDPAVIDRLRVEAGIGPLDPTDPDAQVSLEKATRFLDLAVEHTGNPYFGLDAGLTMSRSTAGALGLAIRAADTIERAMRTAARYWHVVDDFTEATFDETERGAKLSLRVPAYLVPLTVQRSEMRLAAVWSTACDLAGRRVTPLTVAFQHAPVADPRRHREVFGCRVQFEAERTCIELRAADAALPNRHRDPVLAEVMQRYLEELIARAKRPCGLGDRVRRAIVAGLPEQPPTLGRTARALGLSRRTLQRRLRDEGTSFGEVLDELRLELANRYLADPKMSIGEISFVLGFASQAAFSRAFKRWTGRTPSEVRCG